MRIQWAKMTGDEFEELTCWIMRAEGFENVRVRRGPIDGGWDIDAIIRSRMPNDRVETQSWGVECKRFKERPDTEKVINHFHRMVEPGSEGYLTHVLFVTTSNFTNPTKEYLKKRAKEKRVGLDYWEGPDVENLIEKHLDNSHIRALIAPYTSAKLSFKLLKKACAKQVTSEIGSRVGRKYIPELYRPRPIENNIRDFIEADLEQIQISELTAELKALKLSKVLATDKKQWLRIIDGIGKTRSWGEVENLLQELYDVTGEAEHRLIETRVKAAASLLRNCFLTKEKAGSGKTNLLCRLAGNIDKSFKKSSTLALFFSCKFHLSQSHSLESVIFGALRAALDSCSSQKKSSLLGNNDDLIHAVSLTLQRHGAQLVIFLDGINENRNLTILDEAILDILLRWNHLPIKFIVTCRDIFWNYFSENAWIRFLYQKKIFDLPEFTLYEIDGIIEEYFNAFEIEGKLLETARAKCRHPLLLRFFCEAHRGTKLKEIEDIRLKNLFDEYWRRKRQEIAVRLGLGKTGIRRVESFLFKLVDAMSDQYTSQLPLYQVEKATSETDLESEKSLYLRFLDEDIIIEELPPGNNERFYMDRRVSFVYDEFYDYMTALSYMRKHDWNNKDEKALCLDMVDLIEDSRSYEQLKGVAEYLILLAEEKAHHEALCAILARMGVYEILCNVLPKLNSDGEWIEDTLLLCLKNIHIFRIHYPGDAKAAFNAIRKTISSCTLENFFQDLTKEVIL